MADLGVNNVWKDLDNSQSDILGPEYDYSKNIPGPSSLGVGSNGSFSQMMTNVNAAIEYVKIMVTGDPPLGNQYFVNTGGACTAPDGSTQSRYNYINNKSVGEDLVPQGLQELSFLSKDLNGLIPGMVGDLEGLNPTYLFKSLVADGTPQCQCYQCQVTDGSPYNFLTPELSPDFDTNLCQPVDTKLCKSSTTESFTNWRTSKMSSIPTIVAVAGILLLTFSGK